MDRRHWAGDVIPKPSIGRASLPVATTLSNAVDEVLNCHREFFSTSSFSSGQDLGYGEIKIAVQNKVHLGARVTPKRRRRPMGIRRVACHTV